VGFAGCREAGVKSDQCFIPAEGRWKSSSEFDHNAPLPNAFSACDYGKDFSGPVVF
jgi:hypothetical protein